MISRALKQMALAASLVACQAAMASPFTSTSPSGVDVTSVGATTVGGIVAEFTGLNGVKIISQLAASGLYVGYANSNPQVIGSQAGYGDAVTGALGGGLASAAFRFSLYDGDSAAGDFDQNDNTLLVNGVLIGDWSAVQAQNTNGVGTALAAGLSGGGFRDSLLDTGWFTVNSSSTLTLLWTAIDAANTLIFSLNDRDAGDNYYDFTQGIDGSLINVGAAPVIVNPGNPNAVPEPAGLALVATALAAAALSRKRMSKK